LFGRTGKCISRTGKRIGRTGKRIGRTGNNISRTGKRIGRTGKHINRTSKKISHTGKRIGRTDKNINRTNKKLNHYTKKLSYTFLNKTPYFIMAKKISENTFGTRLNNAKSLLISLSAFPNYQTSNPDDSPTELQKVIEALSAAYEDEAKSTHAYKAAVDARRNIFSDKENDIKTTVTSVIACIRAQYGKDSLQVASLNELANKTRGYNKSAPKTDDGAKQVSTSQRSYASITQGFADIIASVSVFTPAYTPTNPNVSIEKLKKILEEAQESNQAVQLSEVRLKQARELRDKLYADLNVRTQRVKENVKAIYGTKSTQYAAIKGLRI
jgi:hypothetical protein